MPNCGATRGEHYFRACVMGGRLAVGCALVLMISVGLNKSTGPAKRKWDQHSPRQVRRLVNGFGHSLRAVAYCESVEPARRFADATIAPAQR